MTAFRQADKAAKSRRLPREELDIGSRVMFQLLPRAEVEPAFEPTECEALTCFRVAEYSGGIFWFRLFSRKKRNTMQYLVGCVRTDVVSAGMVRGVGFREGEPLPYDGNIA